MSSQIYRAASRATRSLISASKQSSHVFAEGRAAAAAAAISLRALASYGRANSGSASAGWIYGALALPAVAYMLQVQEMHAVEAEMERTFIAIKPNEQRAMFAEIMSRFERKGFKLVAIKGLPRYMIFFQRRYHHDLKERPFCDLLRDFLSASHVLVMVWEGEGVIRYGRKLIGATDPQKSEPGTIRGDLAVVFGRNFIHTSDGPGTAKDEIKLWFKPEELANYTSDMLLRHMAVILGMAIISSF